MKKLNILGNKKQMLCRLIKNKLNRTNTKQIAHVTGNSNNKDKLIIGCV